MNGLQELYDFGRFTPAGLIGSMHGAMMYTGGSFSCKMNTAGLFRQPGWSELQMLLL